ncbi:hypothetical protein [Mycolicibacterium sphagni]|uniref:hypothetical protein n=1 Tax=Mycolicibacterium sphagni TaxID=1786 RepID=UPI0021F2A268|nr:hypothetical protein [Mycolicibacterium sphagni]MCV7174896.1 hypothetical protein [Mycolicibacterium sphagni]
MNLIESLAASLEPVYEPTTGYGVAGLLIITIPMILTALGTLVVISRQNSSRKDITEVKAGVKATKDQVVNGHGSVEDGADSLRVDLDAKFGEMFKQMAEIRDFIGMTPPDPVVGPDDTQPYDVQVFSAE